MFVVCDKHEPGASPLMTIRPMTIRSILRLAFLASIVAGAVRFGAADPGPTGLFDSLTSRDWLTFGAPAGEVRLTSGNLVVRADRPFDAGGHVGAIWRPVVIRPETGVLYVYVWGYRDNDLGQPGRAYITLDRGELSLTPIGPRDYFGVMIDVTPSGRRYARMIRKGKTTGFHSLPRMGAVDFRFILAPMGEALEIKPSDEDEWVRFPSKENPWGDASRHVFYLHLDSYGDPHENISSNYSVEWVEMSHLNLAHPTKTERTPPSETIDDLLSAE